MDRYKIVIIIPLISPGGAEKMVIDLVNNINHKKFEVYLISLYPQIKNVYDGLINYSSVNVIFLNKKKGFDIETILNLWRNLNMIKPVIVHTHLSAAIYALPWKMFNSNIRMIHTIHNIASKELPKVYLKIMKKFYRSGIVIPIAISDKIRQSIANYYGIHESNIPLIHNGINTKFFVPQKNKVYDNEIKLCCVARFSYQKNHEMLLESLARALKYVNNLQLTLVGDGELRQDIEDKISELGINNKVRLIGNTNNVLQYLQESDIFILSSRYEGLPLSILEAMSCGLAIISTNVGGISDIITDGVEGIIVEPDNINSMVKAICKLANNISLLTNMSNKAYLKSRDFDLINMSKLYEKEYIKLISDMNLK